jgi:hypothetical protein
MPESFSSEANAHTRPSTNVGAKSSDPLKRRAFSACCPKVESGMKSGYPTAFEDKPKDLMAESSSS